MQFLYFFLKRIAPRFVRNLIIFVKIITVKFVQKFYQKHKLAIGYLENRKADKIIDYQMIAEKIENNSNYFSDYFQNLKPIAIKPDILGVKIIKQASYFPNYAGIYHFANKEILIPEIFKLNDTKLPDEMRGIIQFDKKITSATILERYCKPHIIYRHGIPLLSAFNNYWHFLVEQAPKIMIANQLGIDKKIPFLLPDNLHSNFYEIIELLNGDHREIIKVPLRSYNKLLKIMFPVTIETAYHIVDHLLFPFHPRGTEMMAAGLNPLPIKRMVTKIFEHYKIVPKIDSNKKLFLRRNSHYRMPKDQDKLQNFALEHGFQIFEPEKHSFKEQVQICSQASAFMGFSGAGFTNSLFLPTGAKKIYLESRDFESLLLVCFWNQLLSNLYVLDNDYIPCFKGDIHGIPFLTEQNWQDLHNIIVKGSL